MEQMECAHTANVGTRYSEEQQGHHTHSDALTQFKTAMLDAGITPPDNIIGDGHLHRFKIDGKLDGAYVLHLDGKAAGYFEDFKQGIKIRWKQTGKFMPLSEFQKQEFAKKRQALYPDTMIVICGDNDISGVGQKAAIEAAQAINGKCIIPKTPGNDWNDEFTGGVL